MAPKRKAADLTLKSIWDEALIREIMDNEKHRTRMWLWLINNPDKDICDIPFEKWKVKKDAYTVIRRDFVKFTTKIVDKSVSARGDSTKLLVELQDGHRVETVVMIHVSHATVCVSSQIGCQMGCRCVVTHLPHCKYNNYSN
jgi:adenine C2-methylase RlmN of 23S rRNA A2503 and tRNA A37